MFIIAIIDFSLIVITLIELIIFSNNQLLSNSTKFSNTLMYTFIRPQTEYNRI